MKSIKEKSEEYTNGFHPSIQRMCNESFVDGATCALSVLFDASYKEDWISNPKECVRRFFEIYKQLKK